MTRNQRLHIRVDDGAGPAVVLLHGFPLDGSVWVPVAAYLCKKYRVIVPDLRGFGLSHLANPGRQFAISELASDVAEQLHAMGVAKAVVAGLSMGGYVMLELWRNYPELVAGLAIVNSKAESDSPAGKQGRDETAALARSHGASAIAERMIAKMLHVNNLAPNSTVRSQLMAVMEACPAETIALASIAMRDRADFSGSLAQLSVPARVIVGAADQIIPVELARATAQAMPVGRLVVVPGAGHLSPLESPAAVAGAIEGLAIEAFGEQ